MAKIRTGLSKDHTYVVIDKGYGWERFLIKEEHNIFLGYGTHIRTPDVHINVLGDKYAIYYADGKNIKLPFHNGIVFEGLAVKE